MRITPVALFCHQKDFGPFVQMCVDATEVTHTHPEGIVGAIFQALAIRFALEADPSKEVQLKIFISFKIGIEIN